MSDKNIYNIIKHTIRLIVLIVALWLIQSTYADYEEYLVSSIPQCKRLIMPLLSMICFFVMLIPLEIYY
jgi:uncharacterized membrane protein